MAQKRLKEASSKFYIEVKYLQFFIIIFIHLTIFLLVNLIDK